MIGLRRLLRLLSVYVSPQSTTGQDMEITIIREYQTSDATLGRLLVDGEEFCYTLEDLQRKEKIRGKTAIPCGRYKVIVDFSNRFQKELPHILDVPNFTGVRFHGGNTAEDTEGCPLLAKSRTKDRIYNCAVVVKEITRRIKEEGHAWLTVKSNFPVEL